VGRIRRLEPFLPLSTRAGDDTHADIPYIGSQEKAAAPVM
jgi:hypothetical protein